MIKNELRYVNDFNSLATVCDDNFMVLCKHVNDNERNIDDLVSAVAKLTKKCKHRASKLGLFLTIAAGVAYVVKNEIDKKELTEAVLKQGKRQYGLEDEGEPIEPLGI